MIIQTITLRYDHMSSQNHIHIWDIQTTIGYGEQCAVKECQAISVKHITLRGIEEIYNCDNPPSDICSKCGGESPCSRCIPHLLEQNS